MQSGGLTFDHLGVIVPDIDAGFAMFDPMFGPLSWSHRVDDPALGVSVRFARDKSGLIYELVAPLGTSSPVARTLKSRSNLLNHVAYRTRTLEPAVERFRRLGAVPVGPPSPAVAFGGARIQFVMSPLGFLTELIELDRATHPFD